MGITESKVVLFFVKYPTPGRVKNRLAVDVGDRAACAIYKGIVERIAADFSKGEFCVVVCYDPFESEQAYRDWLGDGFEYMPQRTGDIGVRMCGAFEDVFSQGLQRAVLVGSDVPDLRGRHIAGAFGELKKFDTVIGPATDGGYYLIGFNAESFAREVFDGVEWSTQKVFGQTVCRLRERDRSFLKLEELCDVDRVEDWANARVKIIDRSYKGVTVKCTRSVRGCHNI